jgi:type VI secretion system protein ImpG
LPSDLRQADCGGAIHLDLRGPVGLPISTLEVDKLRFFLDGENSLVHILHEMLHCHLLRACVRGKSPVWLPAGSVTPVGFETGEAMLAYSQRSLTAYRLLEEYFAFPDKFLFFDISGCAKVWAPSGVQQSVDLYFLLPHSAVRDHRQRLETGINARTFRLNCTPIVNLFEQTCEPILLDQRTPEYHIAPDIRRPMALEIYSVDEVSIASAGSQQILACEPFHSPRGQTGCRSPERFYATYRRPSNRSQDLGTDMVISFVDRSRRPSEPKGDTVNIRATCTNRDLPSRLPFGNAQGDFELDGNAPVNRIVALRKPTAPLRPPIGRGSLWNLLSILSLNHLSLVEDGKGALQTVLQLCDRSSSANSRRPLDGLVSVKSNPRFAGLPSEHGITFVRGTRVDLELDEEQFVGHGLYLFASVLERFLGLYCSLNSFSQLTVKLLRRGEVLREWPPRAAQRLLM